MAELNLEKYGISGITEIVHNPSYEALYEEETKPGLTGYEVGQIDRTGYHQCYDRHLHRPFS